MVKRKRYAVINVVAQPHPQGVYRAIFEIAGRNQSVTNISGDRFACISPPSNSVDGVFRGRLAVWTEIDQDEPVIFKSSLEQSLLSDTEIDVPTEVGFNSKIFYYAFRESDHTLFVELSNESGSSISPKRVFAAFSGIFSKVQIKEIEDISVYLKSQKNSVERVLGTNRISRFELVVNIPNPDDLQSATQQVFDELNEQKASRLSIDLLKSRSSDTLVLSERHRIIAEVAKDNGYCKAIGFDEKGTRVARSSKEYPEIVEATLNKGETDYRKIASVARDYGK